MIWYMRLIYTEQNGKMKSSGSASIRQIAANPRNQEQDKWGTNRMAQNKQRT